jgi:hypothetical protein
VSQAAALPLQPSAQRLGSLFWAALGVLVLSTVILLLITDGDLTLTALPMLLVILGWLIWKLPLRTTLFCFMFVAMLVEGPILEEVPIFGPPLRLGCQLVLLNLNIITGVGALAFNSVDLIAVVLFAAIWYRKARRSPIDSVGQFRSPTPLVAFSLVTLAATLVLFALGVLRGGDFRNSLWQVHALLFVPLLFLLFQAAIRGPQDYPALGKLVVWVALLRAGLVLLVVSSLNQPIEHAATSHSDSVLFSVACAILVARLAERPSARRLGWCVLLLPILFAAMVANNRRLVWVELAAALLTIYLMNPWTAFKRTLARGALLSIPLLIPYLVAGWNSPSRLFKPVSVIASMTSSSHTDASTVMRDIENFNLLNTLKLNPLFGIGWGHPYVEFIRAIDISRLFPQYGYLPHNGLLALFAFNGVVGFFLLFALPVVGVFFAARAYHRAVRPDDRAAAVSAICVVACHLVQCFGDIGTTSWTSVFLLGPALAVAGKLAVVTGAWHVGGSRLPCHVSAAQPLRWMR